ncbi:ECF RNA polymerase sigma factor SigW [Aquisphaera giovannonii]|uniref:ECF RNA polymerase sigma factor SigW n=1 Tax=Aquisphaera giovannonii TaxID=406548 RepID=A0A5B9W394_9BACT|nr:sigma-70 family RNA polymerase sigma factor [Aquisphaera giovannonii]QEH34561.1 ECF RNA polymerase sigma factor SigW [Aquisphaera giovannonii]
MQSDGEIVRAVLRGQREAFAALVIRHERAVWATAWRVLRDGHAASDAGQEAFLMAFRRLRDLRDPDQFGAWLLRIAGREAARLARRRAREPGRSQSLDDCGIEAPAGLSEGSEELLEALARLPDHERVVVSLRYLDGLPVAEVAAALGRPVGTVTKQLSRAIERLKAHVNRGVTR